MTALNKKARLQLKAMSATAKSVSFQNVLYRCNLNLISAFIIVGDMEKTINHSP